MRPNSVTSMLNNLLADGTLFYQKLRHYHWEVQGEQFFELHTKFEEIYDRFSETNDEIAERIITLGERPLATLSQALKLSSLKEDPDSPNAHTMVTNLVSDMEQIASSLNDGIKLAGDVQKDSWMLRAYLNRAFSGVDSVEKQAAAVS